VAKKKKVDNTAMNVGMGVAGGALVGAGLGARSAIKTRRRVPALAKSMAKTAQRKFEANEMSANRYSNKARDFSQTAQVIGQNSDMKYRDPFRGENMGRKFKYQAEAREQASFATNRQREANAIKKSGRMDRERNQDKIESKLAAVGNKASKRKTLKRVARGAAAGGAIALLASLVAKELSKGGSKKRG
jgi:cell division septum initiation protein DivIVA